MIISGNQVMGDNIFLDIVTITKEVNDDLFTTLENVSGQSYPNINHIIIYAKSEALDLAKLETFQHQKTLLFFPQQGKGISSAFNTGLIHSQGKLVLFLNSGDTLVNEDVIEQVMKDYEKDKWLWATGETISVSKNKHLKRYRKQHQSWQDSLFFYGNPICHQSTFYSRELIEQSGFYNESLPMGMDYEYNLRANQLTSPQLLYFPIAYYDTTGVSSTRVFQQFFNHRRIRDRYFKLSWLKHLKADIYCFTKALYRLAMIPAKLLL